MALHQHAEGKRGGRSRGFTLVEILLAVSLLSIMVTVMYSAFHTMGRIMRRTQQTKDTYQAARLIMARMRQDLSCAYASPTQTNFMFRGENIEEADGAADALTFVSSGHIISGRDVPEGDFAEISYYLDENNPGILVRREDLSPDDEREVGGTLSILGKNVVGLDLTYLDGTEQTARRAGGMETLLDETLEEEEAWLEEWDPEEKTYLPRAVRINVWLQNERQEVEDFSTTVVLAMGRTATSTQPTASGLAQSPAAPPRGRGAGRRPESPGGRPPREGPPPGRGDREGFRPGRDRRGQEGTRGSRTTPGSTGIRRTSPNAGTGTRPPTPGRR